jgi:hypothetical protein
MKKRFTIIPICIIVLALFLGANSIGCGGGNSSSSASADESDNPADQNPTGNDNPTAVTTPSSAYYWVSTEGSDDNPGTQEKPFRTLYKAATECYETAPKDIYIYPGTYEEAHSLFFPPNVSIYGLGSRTVDPMKYRPVIDLRGCEYDDCYLGLIGSNSSYNAGSDVTIDGLKIYAKGIGIWAYDTSLTLTNNEIVVSGADRSTGISVDSGNDVASIVVSDNTITTEDLTAANGRTEAISILSGAAAIDILDNTISAGQGNIHSAGISLNNFTNAEQSVLIKGNSVTAGDSLELSGGIFSAYAHDLRIEQNTITAGDLQTSPNEPELNTGIYIYSNQTQTPTNAMIINNAIYGGSGSDRTSGIYLDNDVDAFIVFNTIDAGSGTTTETAGIHSSNGASTNAYNNILCAGPSNHSYGIYEIRGSAMELKNNLFCDDLDTFYETHADNALPQSYTDVSVINALGVEFANNVSGDPNFANFAAHDYHIVFPSDAVDAGRSVAGIVFDLDGNARARGQAPDIGAYELR